MNKMISFNKVTSLFRGEFGRTAGKLAAIALALGLSQIPSAFGASQSDLDQDAFLSAIAEVETGGDTRAVGLHGERGLYQFRSGVWKQYTNRSFFQAHNPNVAHSVASKHFQWLYDGFVRNGRQPTVYMMAAAWNGGLNRALTGRLPKTTRSYAQRVSNIVAISELQQVAQIESVQPIAWEEAPRVAWVSPYVRFRTAID